MWVHLIMMIRCSTCMVTKMSLSNLPKYPWHAIYGTWIWIFNNFILARIRLAEIDVYVLLISVDNYPFRNRIFNKVYISGTRQGREKTTSLLTRTQKISITHLYWPEWRHLLQYYPFTEAPLSYIIFVSLFWRPKLQKQWIWKLLWTSKTGRKLQSDVTLSLSFTTNMSAAKYPQMLLFCKQIQCEIGNTPLKV